jgi:hypothetical protein
MESHIYPRKKSAFLVVRWPVKRFGEIRVPDTLIAPLVLLRPSWLRCESENKAVMRFGVSMQRLPWIDELAYWGGRLDRR